MEGAQTIGVPECHALAEHKSDIVKVVSSSANVEQFADGLVREGLIDAQRRLTLRSKQTCDYVEHLFRSAITIVSITPSKYKSFISILKEQPVLSGIAKKVEGTTRSLKLKATRKRKLETGMA